jgi:4'-phosphopantetheinyl transferase
VVVHVWTMRVDGLDEVLVSPWLAVLDAAERERAARFVFPRHRAQFIAAHWLARAALSALAEPPPEAWRFVSGTHGKPVAWIGDCPGPVSFNLSHTEGMVGVAAAASPDLAIGFDLEAASRQVEWAIAERYFLRPELAWLESLPESARADGFLRLWTLREAFVKATGAGLTADLAAFWFEAATANIQFAPGQDDDAASWWFEQRHLDEAFVAALGVRRFVNVAVKARWIAVAPTSDYEAIRLPEDSES